jgi:pimeloyl-ACP methyl ester carboxylesterase
MAMDATRVARLEVPGARLHYDVRGAGPVLLVVPGMPADAGLYSVLARRLAGSFTVVTYDPRGMSRSQLDGPPTDQRVEVHADDARRVLDAVGAGPAHVLTDSISGLVGLHLAVTEPELLRTLVVFEPPVTELLPDRERWRAFYKELHDTYRTQGLYPALQSFAEAAGLGGGEPPDPDPDPETTAAMARMDQNLDFWLAHVVRPSFMGYTPDVPALRAAPARIVVAIGDASAPHQVAWQATHALAERLGTTLLAVPGDHEVITRHPGEVAELLRGVLEPGGRRSGR